MSIHSPLNDLAHQESHKIATIVAFVFTILNLMSVFSYAEIKPLPIPSDPNDTVAVSAMDRKPQSWLYPTGFNKC